ncbi:MAG: hypothetical protein JNM39_04270 [Bdellovibrionaceae bacterium]|nr:hypothetical protein [Pseudobdellovibrionaceae bacterium]
MLRNFRILLFALLSGFLLFGNSGWSKEKNPKNGTINYNDPNMGLHTNGNDNQLSVFVDLSIPQIKPNIPTNAIPNKILIPQSSTPEVKGSGIQSEEPQPQATK